MGDRTMLLMPPKRMTRAGQLRLRSLSIESLSGCLLPAYDGSAAGLRDPFQRFRDRTDRDGAALGENPAHLEARFAALRSKLW